jgi:hypothetical protein
MLYEQNNLVGVSIDKVNAANRVRWGAARTQSAIERLGVGFLNHSE